MVKLYNKKLITSIIDDKNKVISIAYKSMDNSITFKDSYRIFPIKLDDLCQIFKVSNKIINIIIIRKTKVSYKKKKKVIIVI